MGRTGERKGGCKEDPYLIALEDVLFCRVFLACKGLGRLFISFLETRARFIISVRQQG